MSIDELVAKVAEIEHANIGRGHKHPLKPAPDYRHDFKQLLQAFPFLNSHRGYLAFLERYGGAEVYSPERRADGSFLYVKIYGAGPWSFTDESPDPMANGFYIFAVVEIQPPAGERVPDRISSYGFSEDPRCTDVFAEVHEIDQQDLVFRPFCSGFAEWLELLIEAKGWLLPNHANRTE